MTENDVKSVLWWDCFEGSSTSFRAWWEPIHKENKLKLKQGAKIKIKTSQNYFCYFGSILNHQRTRIWVHQMFLEIGAG